MTAVSEPAKPSRRSIVALDGFNFFLTDLQTGIGPYLAVFLASVRHFNPAAVGIATAAGGFATVLMQTPAGAITDATSRKRLVVALAALIGAVGAVVLVNATAFWVIVSVQIIVGAAFAFLPCAVGALSLGLVGRDALPTRQGTNQAFNSSGNIAYAVTAGILGKVFSLAAAIYAIAVFGILTALSALAIRERDIDHERAREATNDDKATDGKERLRQVFADRRVVTFTAVVLLFHLANASMLVLFGQLLPKGSAAGPSLYLSAGIVGAQILMVGVALIASRYADRLGRKPVFAFGIGVLIARGVLFALTTKSPNLMVAVQVLDGLGAGIYNVVWVLVAADLARGTGRFNLMQGVFATAQGLGGALSNVAAGFLATAFGFPATFLTLAAVAGCAFIVLVVRMPETRAAAGRAQPASAAA
jgi:MFS family permease